MLSLVSGKTDYCIHLIFFFFERETPGFKVKRKFIYLFIFFFFRCAFVSIVGMMMYHTMYVCIPNRDVSFQKQEGDTQVLNSPATSGPSFRMNGRNVLQSIHT